ncbi:MAG: rod shape-determining protein RodA [Candidatus Marinimicrobia bacterium]|nr:rod shape-determining protein RodA [Candidatus Neomarinimicrobiota bacterium]MBT3633631.1 rod shape-determining protein RodA [Candidatus Neomarinimicrobiota bacterium]MBT3682416.1 rod shape-determining protein RodA [Candidatus Neomarinimicrobiota bacterium]MBT3759180.1 rod shape-determining protein RodA [Candidatus Neomarinimicrobiota bacterium]MBT3895547.1 rod shape-determining protein RodA [Candidatus Neomarinimicrobiota bacterium]
MIKKLFIIPPSLKLYWRIILPVIFLCVVSLFLLKSTSNQAAFFNSTLFRQMIWILAGAIGIVIIQYLRIQLFYEFGYFFYGFLIFLLILTMFMPTISGAKRWIMLGPINFQPSEIGKIIVIFVLAKFLSDRREIQNSWMVILISITLALVPALLVFKQPDLGTAIVYLAVTIPMLYWVGVKPFYLFIVIAPIVSILAASNLISFYIWIIIILITLFIIRPKLKYGILILVMNISFGTLTSFIWSNLYPHQRERVLTFLDPMKDPHGAGYQIIQSMTAIGSGGLTGKGFGLGTQTHLRFLPVRDTDFILSVAGEEFGFLGILLILGLFLSLFFWMITYAQKITNKFASLSIIGFASLLFVHLFINLSMTIGIFPVTGLPAPFISYGGTFLLTCLCIIGITNNIISQNI